MADKKEKEVDLEKFKARTLKVINGMKNKAKARDLAARVLRK